MFYNFGARRRCYRFAERNIIMILRRNIYKLQNPYTECTAASGDVIYMVLEHPFGGCLGSLIVKGVWCCRARRALSICGSIFTKIKIFIWIMTPLLSKKTSVAAAD